MHQGGTAVVPAVSLVLYGGQNLMSPGGTGIYFGVRSSWGGMGADEDPKFGSRLYGLCRTLGSILECLCLSHALSPMGRVGCHHVFTGVAVLVSLVTMIWIPETRRKSLEDTDREEIALPRTIMEHPLLTET